MPRSHAILVLAAAAMLAGCGEDDRGELAIGARYVLRAPDGSCPAEYQPHAQGAPPPGVTDVRLTVSGGALTEPVSAKFVASDARIAIDELPAGGGYALRVEALSGLEVSWAGGATDIRVMAGRTTRVALLLTRVGGLTCTAGAMGTARFHHTASLRPDGTVLIVGGFTAIGDSCGTGCVELPATDEAELFNPLTGEFQPAGRMHHPRALHTAIPLRDGRVVVIGGTGTGAEYRDLAPFPEYFQDPRDPALTTLEIWDPMVGEGGGFMAPTSFSPGRLRASSALLDDGRGLVVGGLDLAHAGAARADAQVFDPNMPGGGGLRTTLLPLASTDGRLAGTADGLSGGRALLWGGNRSGAFAELFEPGADATQDGFRAFREQDSRGLHTQMHASTVLPDGRVLVTGGLIPTGGTGYDGPQRGSTRLVDTSDAGQIIDRSRGAPQLATARFAHAAARVADDGVLVAGGYAAIGGEPLDSVETWRPAEGGDFAGAATLSEPRAHLTATALPDGTVLLAGGRRSAVGVSRVAEIYRAE